MVGWIFVKAHYHNTDTSMLQLPEVYSGDLNLSTVTFGETAAKTANSTFFYYFEDFNGNYTSQH